MSSAAHAAPRGFGTRAMQLVALLLMFGMMWASIRYVTDAHESVEVIASLGLVLIGGTLASELLEPLRIPHLSAYLGVGILAGPYVLHLIQHETVEALTSLNSLALALIALAGGAELKLDLVKKGARTLAITSLVQTVLVFSLMTLIVFLVSPLIGFTKGMSRIALLGFALLWGTLAVTRSPSATLGILSQTRAQGPLARSTLSFVMTSDIIIVSLAALAITLVKPMLEPGAALSTHALKELGREILGSVSLGTTIGLVIIAYLRFVDRQFLVVLVGLGSGFTEILRYLNLEPLLTFLVAGFLVQNLSKQGDKFLHAIEDMGSIVYVVFFATAGAHLNIPVLKQLWPVALILFASRMATTILSNAIAMRWAKETPALRKWGWSGLISQAGVALALGATVERAYPQLGTPFRALVIASVGVNEVTGPFIFKFALDALGETSSAPERDRLSTVDHPPASS